MVAAIIAFGPLLAAIGERAAPVEAAPDCTNPPGANQVQVFADDNFSGDCSVFGKGKYSSLKRKKIGDDGISSVRVGDNVTLVLYENPRFGGKVEYFADDDDYLPDNFIGFDTASSLKVKSRAPLAECRTDDPESDQIFLYQDPDFDPNGDTVCEVFRVGADPILDNNPMLLSTAQSIKVGGDVTAILFSGADFDNAASSFTQDDPDLSNDAVGADNTWSLKVYPRTYYRACQGANPAGNEVFVYAATDFGQICEAFTVGEDRFLTDNAIRNDTISSLKVGSGVNLTVYPDSDFFGTPDVFAAGTDIANMGVSSPNVGNDAASSLRVEST